MTHSILPTKTATKAATKISFRVLFLSSVASLFLGTSLFAQTPGGLPAAEIGEPGLQGRASAGPEYTSTGDLRLIVGVTASYQSDDTDHRTEYFLIRGQIGFGSTPSYVPGNLPTGPVNFMDVSFIPYSELRGMTPSEARIYLAQHQGHVTLVRSAIRGPVLNAVMDSVNNPILRAQAFLLGYDVSAVGGNAQNLLANRGIRGFVNWSINAFSLGYANDYLHGHGLTYSLGRAALSFGADLSVKENVTLRLTAGASGDMGAVVSFPEAGRVGFLEQFSAFTRAEAIFDVGLFQVGAYIEGGNRASFGGFTPASNYFYGTVGVEVFTNR